MNNDGSTPLAAAAQNADTQTPDTRTPSAAADLARQADIILNSILLLIAASFRILGARTLPLWHRVSRTRQHLARLLAHLAAGRLPRQHAPRPNATRTPAERDPMDPIPPPRLPRARLFLVKLLGYPAAGFGSQLQHLLDQPGMAEALAASPAAARTLRPLCHILGVTLPPLLRLPPRPPRPRPARPVRPKPPTLPPLLPLYPQRKPRPLPFIPGFSKIRPA